MAFLYPGNVVSKVVYRRDARKRPRESEWREHKTKTNRVVRGITLLGESFARVAVTERIDDVVCQRPGVACRNTGRVRPDVRRRSIWKLLFTTQEIVDHVNADECLLLAVEIEVKFARMGIPFDGNGCVEPESAAIELVSD